MQIVRICRFGGGAWCVEIFGNRKRQNRGSIGLFGALPLLALMARIPKTLQTIVQHGASTVSCFIKLVSSRFLTVSQGAQDLFHCLLFSQWSSWRQLPSHAHKIGQRIYEAMGSMKGTFAPSIYIGACLGGALGRMIEATSDVEVLFRSAEVEVKFSRAHFTK